jgi:hypothetical protein
MRVHGNELMVLESVAELGAMIDGMGTGYHRRISDSPVVNFLQSGFRDCRRCGRRTRPKVAADRSPRNRAFWRSVRKPRNVCCKPSQIRFRVYRNLQGAGAAGNQFPEFWEDDPVPRPALSPEALAWCGGLDHAARRPPPSAALSDEQGLFLRDRLNNYRHFARIAAVCAASASTAQGRRRVVIADDRCRQPTCATTIA